MAYSSVASTNGNQIILGDTTNSSLLDGGGSILSSSADATLLTSIQVNGRLQVNASTTAKSTNWFLFSFNLPNSNYSVTSIGQDRNITGCDGNISFAEVILYTTGVSVLDNNNIIGLFNS